MYQKTITNDKKNTLYLYKIIYVLSKLLKSDAIFIGESNWNEPQGKFLCIHAHPCQYNTRTMIHSKLQNVLVSANQKQNKF